MRRARLPKQAIVISLIVMAGVLIIGFAACRSRDVFGRHMLQVHKRKSIAVPYGSGPVSSVMLLRG